MNIAYASSLGVAGVLALAATPAMSQVTAGSNEIHAYVGGMFFGNDLTKDAVNGRKPKLEDSITYGVRYDYNFTDMWGIDLSGGYTPSKVKDLAFQNNIDMNLATLDVDAIWNFMPKAPVAWYLVAGPGYVFTDLKDDIVGFVNGAPVTIKSKDSWSVNAGIGLKWFATEQFLVRADARYRYIDKVVDKFSQSQNTYEVSLGIGWKF